MTKTGVALCICSLAVSFAFHIEDSHDESKKDYQYDYSVHDPHHDGYHSHQESSKDGVVRGYYSVKEADGSLREVHYTADPKEGFKAIVTKNGVQVHPQPGVGSESGKEHNYLSEEQVPEQVPEHQQELGYQSPPHQEEEHGIHPYHLQLEGLEEHYPFYMTSSHDFQQLEPLPEHFTSEHF